MKAVGRFLTVIVIITCGLTVVAGAAAAPVKLVLSNQILGSFVAPHDVAVAPGGNVYVADTAASRIQELTSSGVFVAMFGWDVNQTEDGEPGATQAEKNRCTAASGDICTSGVSGTAAGQLTNPYSIAIDAGTGDIYVQEVSASNRRVDAFTAEGQFIWTAGKEVDETKVIAVKAKGGTPTQQELEEENLCTAASGDICKGGSAGVAGAGEHNAFDFIATGNLLAVGPTGVLYVGDDGRVQELKGDGSWLRQISLASIPSTPGDRVGALAVDGTGDMFVAYPAGTGIVRELGPNGEALAEIPVASSEREATTEVDTLAVDPSGHLAVGAEEIGQLFSFKFFGALYEVSTGHRITLFTGPGPGGIAFNETGELYAAASFNSIAKTGDEVLQYLPLPVAELTVEKQDCVSGPELETDATVNCTFNGLVNPENVPSTEVWFEWGNTCELGSLTPRMEVPTGNMPVQVSALIEGLRPNGQEICYQLAGNDENVPSTSGEILTSVEKISFSTPIVPPQVIGALSVSFVRASSAVMFDEVNPENADTESYFEYATGTALSECPLGLREESCPGVAATKVARASCFVPKPGEGGEVQCVYGPLGVTLEATGLQPGAVYHYRLFAKDENLKKTEQLTSMAGPRPGAEGQFVTAIAPVPRAVTEDASVVGTTTATISGAVDPDGLPATYSFELGVYKGASTQYGVVFTGPAGSSSGFVQEHLALSGLQPGTTYAYRIAVSSGYVPTASHSIQGDVKTFMTVGPPEELSSPQAPTQLAIPATPFPKPPKKATRAEELAKALKLCGKKPKRRRISCDRKARAKYSSHKTKTAQGTK